MFDLNKKEKPFTSFSGFGGGGLGLSGGVTKQSTYIDDVFSTFLYTGTGSTQSINNGIDLAGEGGLVWIKCRTTGHNNVLYDTERGVTTDSSLESNNSNAAENYSNRVTAFSSDGFTLGSNTSVNQGGVNNDFVSWSFRKQKGFFDVVTYTGNGTAGRTIPHALGSVPGMIIVKRTDASNSWNVYHRSLTGTHYLELETSGSAGAWDGAWNNTNPTSTHFTVGSSPTVNNNGGTYVAYVFAHDNQSFGTDEDESIIKCGSYTGNGGTNEINLGFEAQWLLIKDSSSATNWFMVNNMMNDKSVVADESSTEVDNSYGFDGFKSTGFAVKSNNNNFNGSGHTYIYMAIRRPNKPPELATDVFAIATQVGTVPNFASSFPVDFGIRLLTAGGNSTYSQTFMSRLTGEGYLSSSSTNIEATGSFASWDKMNGWGDFGGLGYGYSFKRAPGFMDVVTWTGDGAAVKNVAHNLEKVPEMVISKMRGPTSGSSSYGGDRWYVYHKDAGGTLGLNQSGGIVSSDIIFNPAPTATNLPFDDPSYDSQAVNGSGKKYIAYLFATLAGISKVGSYTGTGNNVNVDCGFTSGARFIMIKRINGTGGWYVWDTLRGIGSGNDPYLLLNDSAAQVTNTDYIDPLNAGFTVTASAPAALNASGGTYLFFAIA